MSIIVKNSFSMTVYILVKPVEQTIFRNIYPDPASTAVKMIKF